ncbi:hypothetical protein SHI21_07485 [Bacteriovorax sp. PP10]|uniref:Uncharacterized protein n=1 Tax=Bacteriovorax antarcticus TaxID=3088717 RepID=A0ABU5VSK0_9BACT|nr:hypothetical protein [Bacteriovorax sp. PP10]MEA9356036.1 hypothetical protein [Bacteriovorax sp. PP10]
MRLLILTMALAMTSLSGHTADLTFALPLCPQDGRNTMEAFHTTAISINDGSVNLGSGGTEPNFSSEIQWLENGDVVLVRKNKINILLGNGQRPDLRSACGTFSFEQNPELDMSLKTKTGMPYPVCGERGCMIVHPKTDTLTIKFEDEVIVYVGRKA